MDEQDSSLTYFVQQLLTKPLDTFIRGNEVIYQTNVQLFRIDQRANDPLQAPNFSPWLEKSFSRNKYVRRLGFTRLGDARTIKSLHCRSSVL